MTDNQWSSIENWSIHTRQLIIVICAVAGFCFVLFCFVLFCFVFFVFFFFVFFFFLVFCCCCCCFFNIWQEIYNPFCPIDFMAEDMILFFQKVYFHFCPLGTARKRFGKSLPISLRAGKVNLVIILAISTSSMLSMFFFFFFFFFAYMSLNYCNG